MIERAIHQRIAEGSKTDGNNEITVKQILKDVSQKELYDFIVRQAQHNSERRNTILLEFAHKTKTNGRIFPVSVPNRHGLKIHV